MNMFYVPNHVLEHDFLENVFFLKLKGRRNEKLGSIEKTGDEGHFRRTKMGSICVAQICLHKRLSKRGAFEKIDFLINFGFFSVLHPYSSTCAKKFDQKSRGRF